MTYLIRSWLLGSRYGQREIIAGLEDVQAAVRDVLAAVSVGAIEEVALADLVERATAVLAQVPLERGCVPPKRSDTRCRSGWTCQQIL